MTLGHESSRPTRIDFYWDIGSTNTYFALHLIKPIARRYGATIHYQPFNLGYVFRHQNYVLMDEPRAKISNRKRDLMRWANKYDLPFRVPDQFPIKTSRALRGALVMRDHDLEQAYLDAIFSRYWEHNDASIADYSGLNSIAESLGLDASHFEKACESDKIREALVSTTNEGLARGVFGAPSFVINDEIYWGKDRFEFIEAHLAGKPELP